MTVFLWVGRFRKAQKQTAREFFAGRRGIWGVWELRLIADPLSRPVVVGVVRVHSD
jgi:hypothetical protein